MLIQAKSILDDPEALRYAYQDSDVDSASASLDSESSEFDDAHVAGRLQSSILDFFQAPSDTPAQHSTNSAIPAAIPSAARELDLGVEPWMTLPLTQPTLALTEDKERTNSPVPPPTWATMSTY